MKSKKNVIALCLCILMLFSLACVCSASTLSGNGASQQVMVADRATDSDNTLGYSNEELKSMNQFDKSFLSKANSAYEAHEKLINSFGAPEIKASDFPEYYGGDYIDDEGNLVVYVASNSNDYQQRILQSIGSAKVIFKPSKYSFKSLTEIMNILNAYKLSNPSDLISKNYNSYQIRDDQNDIVVYLDDYSQAQIDTFKEQVIDTPAITFEKATEPVHDYVNVNPGSAITCGTSGGSVGYRARVSGQSGIVTAAHFVPLNSNVAKSGTNFAQCTTRQESGSVDAAFCQITNTSYTPTNTINGTSDTLSTTISEPGVGTVINMVGATSGHLSGKIVSTNATATVGGVTFTNLTSADFLATNGDSGCIVYSYISSTNTRYTLGIVKCGSSSVTYYCKANQINSALGTSRY